MAVGPLNLLQVFAWTGMLFEYSQGRSMATAAEMTFSGEHPCEMCCAIAKTKANKTGDGQAPAPDRTERQQARQDLRPLGDDVSLATPPLVAFSPPNPTGKLLGDCVFHGELSPPPPQALPA